MTKLLELKNALVPRLLALGVAKIEVDYKNGNFIHTDAKTDAFYFADSNGNEIDVGKDIWDATDELLKLLIPSGVTGGMMEWTLDGDKLTHQSYKTVHCEPTSWPDTPSPSFTVWVYQTDFNAYHHNDLATDTFDSGEKAEAVARQRVKATDYNTGWAKVIDNNAAGKSGNLGVVLFLKKKNNGAIYASYRDKFFGPF